MGPQGDAAAVVEAAAVDDVVAAAACGVWNTREGLRKYKSCFTFVKPYHFVIPFM